MALAFLIFLNLCWVFCRILIGIFVTQKKFFCFSSKHFSRPYGMHLRDRRLSNENKKKFFIGYGKRVGSFCLRINRKRIRPIFLYLNIVLDISY